MRRSEGPGIGNWESGIGNRESQERSVGVVVSSRGDACCRSSMPSAWWPLGSAAQAWSTAQRLPRRSVPARDGRYRDSRSRASALLQRHAVDMQMRAVIAGTEVAGLPPGQNACTRHQLPRRSALARDRALPGRLLALRRAPTTARRRSARGHRRYDSPIPTPQSPPQGTSPRACARALAIKALSKARSVWREIAMAPSAIASARSVADTS